MAHLITKERLEMATEIKVCTKTEAKQIILEAQKAFTGLADELGLKTEDDAVRLCREVRKENMEKQYAYHA
jgi:hypothetical protein